jgi:hypothetical protein
MRHWIIVAAAGAAPAQAATEFQKGMNYVTWWADIYSSPTSDQSLRDLADTGTTWIALVVTGYQPTYASTRITWRPPQTPTDADLAHVIAMAHSLGMKVMLRPIVDLSSDDAHWRADIGTAFRTRKAWSTWFASYNAFIGNYASVAERYGADMFCIGVEMEGVSRRTTEWRQVAANVRARYAGPIVYSANWGGEEARITWWDAVDYIGVDAYYELSDVNNPTLAALKAAWISRGYVAVLERLATTFQRPVLITELGYRSINGAARAPWDWSVTGAVDFQEQADAYQAAFETFRGRPWLAGIYWYNWDVEPADDGSDADRYTPRGKPAEEILRYYNSQL